MKTAITIVMTLGLVAVCGCQSSSSRRGGVASKGEGFTIGVPASGTSVKQGELQTVTVSLHRGEYFKQDVRLQITASEGLSIDPTNVLIKASENPDVQLQIAATKDTALGAYRVSVNATPKTGKPTSVGFTVKVVGP